MAIYSAVPPPPEAVSPSTSPEPTSHAPRSPQTPQTPQTPSHQHIHQLTPSGPIDVEAWTVSALQSLSISPIARGTGTPLSIPLDEAEKQRQKAAQGQEGEQGPGQKTVTIAVDGRQDPIRRPPSRRDSQRRREALLKGKEGSRQRRRWENDRLIHVPNAQPPLPSDFDPRPTHPVHRVPYHLAAFWERETLQGPSLRQRQDDKYLAQQARRKDRQMANGSATGLGAGMVPRDLREYAKRSPAVKNWLRYLEEPVRNYARAQGREASARISKDLDTPRATTQVDDEDTDVEGLDSEDEEIVFVGRKNHAAAAAAQANAPATATSAAVTGRGWKRATREVAGGRKVESGVAFDELGDDESASFKRWLVHSISGYYGLQSRSVTMGRPARRVVYVGMGPGEFNHKPRMTPSSLSELPRPLWEVC